MKTKEDLLFDTNRVNSKERIQNRALNSIKNVYEKKEENMATNVINMQLEDDVQTDKQTEYLQQSAINKVQNNMVGMSSMNMS
jgi:hypothetical protein